MARPGENSHSCTWPPSSNFGVNFAGPPSSAELEGAGNGVGRGAGIANRFRGAGAVVLAAGAFVVASPVVLVVVLPLLLVPFSPEVFVPSFAPSFVCCAPDRQSQNRAHPHYQTQPAHRSPPKTLSSEFMLVPAPAESSPLHAGGTRQTHSQPDSVSLRILDPAAPLPRSL